MKEKFYQKIYSKIQNKNRTRTKIGNEVQITFRIWGTAAIRKVSTITLFLTHFWYFSPISGIKSAHLASRGNKKIDKRKFVFETCHVKRSQGAEKWNLLSVKSARERIQFIIAGNTLNLDESCDSKHIIFIKNRKNLSSNVRKHSDSISVW